MLTLNDVSVYKRGNTLLKEVSCSVVPGELTVILGPNGAGKSTLLNCMIGAELSHDGVIALEGKHMGDWSVQNLSKRRAVVSQSVMLSFPFTALEVVHMGVHAEAVLPDVNGMCFQALEQMGVAQLAHQSYLELSGGERQRVQIARALVQLRSSYTGEIQYLFLDEPTSALDLHHQTQLMIQLTVLAGSGMGIVCVLHDLQLAAQYADRLILLKSGRIMGEGNAATQITQTRIEGLYQVQNHVIPHPTSGRPMVLLE
ncbi:heme ABC transporter ATP-binding protein [Marinomonas sp. 2405UD68-3]|uniref:heme ABC transporter ATP-binding protein n=1 Tax=Marinomonas sp. 2405UD68-3 TaxID=3391835 RepID=UPI0039C8C65A